MWQKQKKISEEITDKVKGEERSLRLRINANKAKVIVMGKKTI